MGCDLRWSDERRRYECACGAWSTSATAKMTCRLKTPTERPAATHVEAPSVPAEHEATWSTLRKVRSLATELAKWIYHGCPTRSPEEVAAIHAICAACDRFVPEAKVGPRCAICGCRTVPPDAADAFTLKPLMATTRCPLDPPKWTASAPS